MRRLIVLQFLLFFPLAVASLSAQAGEESLVRNSELTETVRDRGRCIPAFSGTVLNLSLSQTDPPFTMIKVRVKFRFLGNIPDSVVYLWSPNVPVLDQGGNVTDFLTVDGEPWFTAGDHFLVRAELNEDLDSNHVGFYKPHWIRYLAESPENWNQDLLIAFQGPSDEQPTVANNSFNLNLEREFRPDSIDFRSLIDREFAFSAVVGGGCSTGQLLASFVDLLPVLKHGGTCVHFLLSPLDSRQSHSLAITPRGCRLKISDFCAASGRRGLLYPTAEEYRVLTIDASESAAIVEGLDGLALEYSKQEPTSTMSISAVQHFEDDTLVTGDSYLSLLLENEVFEVLEQALQGNEKGLRMLKDFLESR